MRGPLIYVLLLVVALGSRTPAINAQEVDLSGSWEVEIQELDGSWFHRLTLEAGATRLRGIGMSGSTVEVTRHGEIVQLTYFVGARILGACAGVVRDARITGTCQLEGEVSRTGDARFVARRTLSRPDGAPSTHDFVPTRFYRALTADAEPALSVFPGDTIRTTTLDSGGEDERGAVRAFGGNPATGPFFVHGALPGDTLVVRINRIRLNRDSARSGVAVVSRAYLPNYFRGISPLHWSVGASWHLDPSTGVATLGEVVGNDGTPVVLERLAGIQIPLRPMVGLIGVAPPIGAVRNQDSGNHGGNLDYNQIQAGTTLYLPVYHRGALLFVGDGHAAQGDGELVGNALETTLELELEVDVLPNQSVSVPRLENDEFLMSIGVDGSLTEALRIATSDLSRWLRRDYGFTETEVALVLGTSMQYDIAEVVGRQVSVVAKVDKRLLASASN